MTIEIHEPELEALIQQRMDSGAFRDVDELLTRALTSMRELPASNPFDSEDKNLFEIAAPLRGLFSDDEIDTMFRRDSSTGRTLDLS